jgi:hypothetical protein
MSEGGFIYAIGVEGVPSVKIGKTAGPVIKRLAMLQTGQPAPLKVLALSLSPRTSAVSRRLFITS